MSSPMALGADAPPIIEAPKTALAGLTFENRFTEELRAEDRVGPGSRPVPRAAYSRVAPVVTAAPKIVAWSKAMSEQLGLDDELWSSEEASFVFTGNGLLPGSDPHAANYGGHQFGTWAGQLGDGRAIALGEVVDVDGNHQTLQLKGAGPTPYSRRADGLAVLRSSVREFLCSEAMHHLGVPTTRALSLALTGTEVNRDMFYDGNPALEPGAIVCRVAPSFLRFGTYQLPSSRNEIGELRALTDFTIRHYFADLLGDPPGSDTEPEIGPEIGPEVYAAWFRRVCELSCDLVVSWMRVGFVHGVMNTDNMSIHGLTIDYGPYGWLDDYDPDWTPNTTDAGGRRYRFGYQPQITQWNLLQLANALFPLVDDAEPFEAALNAFVGRFHSDYRAMMRTKLGLLEPTGSRSSQLGADDDELIADLGDVLTTVETDMTIFFRQLAMLDATDGPDGPERTEGADDVLAAERLGAAYYDLAAIGRDERAKIGGWVDRYRARLRIDDRPADERHSAMDSVNPLYVLRNYLAQEAIDAATDGDYSLVNRLADLLERPYTEQPDAERFAKRRPDWARTRAGCSMLSCSS